MKVLLISANTELVNMPVLPLGMAFVAREAEDAGHQVSQINLLGEPKALHSLTERIQRIQVEKMAQSGCAEVSLGMESGSDAMLKRMNKRYRTDDVRHASDLLAANGIRRMGFCCWADRGKPDQR